LAGKKAKIGFQRPEVIHGRSLTLKSEVRLNFSTGRRKSGLLLLSPNEIEDLLLARGEFNHRCSAEHYNKRRTRARENNVQRYESAASRFASSRLTKFVGRMPESKHQPE
jgi:hypothetical protein